MRANTPLTAEELEKALDKRLEDPDFAMPSRLGPLDGAARHLALFGREQQDFILACVARIASMHEQIAYRFVLHAAPALERLGKEGLENWLRHIMDSYDVSGLYAALTVLNDLEKFAASNLHSANALPFAEVERVLAGFVGGLAGRALSLGKADEVYTDTETLFLPDALGQFDSKQDNFRLYKAIAAHLWAQTRFGSFPSDLPRHLAQYADPEHALAWFCCLETARLDACIGRELPGLYREMHQLKEQTGQLCHAAWYHHLQEPNRTVEDSLLLLAQMYAEEPPPIVCYQSLLFPEQVNLTRDKRLKREKRELVKLLADLAKNLKKQDEKTHSGKHKKNQPKPRKNKFRIEANKEAHKISLFLDDRPMPVPNDINEVAQSILQDLGEIPPEWLEAAGNGAYAGGERGDAGEDKKTLPKDTWQYDEWNYRRNTYHKNWCSLREIKIAPVEDDFIRQTLQKHAPLIKHLRRSFEAFRSGEKRLRRQPNGDEVDIDALVEAYGDSMSGMEMTQNLFTHIHKVERDVAVIFLVDMSGSTKGWINDAEREALILLCEALETLGDRYGIYGFSGMTRTRCEIYPVKNITEPYDDAVRARINGIRPKDYTRMGAAIRHVSKLLNEIEAKTRLLITLSDGKPDDFDNYYRGEYGIEDTRQALTDAKRRGIHPFCITIDKEGPEYLPHMYGAVNYTVINEVRKLPLKVADIYRVLTTR